SVMPKSRRARGRGRSRGAGCSGRSARASSQPSPSPEATAAASSPPSSLGATSSQDGSVAAGYSEFLGLIREEVHQQLSSQMSNSQTAPPSVPAGAGSAHPLPAGGLASPIYDPHSDPL
uniref:Uncharacterized protein n=1 Tax=Amphimedon queenslandica TaxID=400682 RepID=A0A1X7TPR7_AMPQE